MKENLLGYHQTSQQKWQVRKVWNQIFKLMKKRHYQPRIIYPGKLCFGSEGEIKTFSDMEKLSEFITRRISWQEILKGIGPPEKKKSQN